MTTSLAPPAVSDASRPGAHTAANEAVLDDEPPPAYTPSATADTQVLDSGPRYPFGPSAASLPPAPSYGVHRFPPPPIHPSLQQAHQPQWQAAPQPPNHQWYPLPPASWPQQPSQAQIPESYLGASSYPSQSHPGPSSAAHHSFPLPGAQLETQWVGPREPTKVPTGGHPLLWDDRVLVYPPTGTVFCSKCCNTGYKGFDPSRPCRKCWDKYGKLWSVVKLSPPSENLNLQRPLPPAPLTNGQAPPPLVVRPGDPRIGGRLCWNCSGSGEVTDEGLLGILFTSTDRCRVCMGAGRTF